MAGALGGGIGALGIVVLGILFLVAGLVIFGISDLVGRVRHRRLRRN